MKSTWTRHLPIAATVAVLVFSLFFLSTGSDGIPQAQAMQDEKRPLVLIGRYQTLVFPTGRGQTVLMTDSITGQMWTTYLPDSGTGKHQFNGWHDYAPAR